MKNTNLSFAIEKARLRRFSQTQAFILLLVLSVAFLIVPGAVRGRSVLDFQLRPAQETFPAPPSDRTLVYVLDEAGALVALPFETGTTPLSTEKVATSDKRSYVCNFRFSDRLRVTAMAQKNYKGFAIDSAEIIKPHYRVLGHEGGLYYMEIRTREMLLPGEYAIIGADLGRIATFRIAGAATSQR